MLKVNTSPLGSVHISAICIVERPPGLDSNVQAPGSTSTTPEGMDQQFSPLQQWEVIDLPVLYKNDSLQLSHRLCLSQIQFTHGEGPLLLSLLTINMIFKQGKSLRVIIGSFDARARLLLLRFRSLHDLNTMKMLMTMTLLAVFLICMGTLINELCSIYPMPTTLAWWKCFLKECIVFSTILLMHLCKKKNQLVANNVIHIHLSFQKL